MNNSFNNYLIKNRVLDNESNLINKLFFDKFNGETTISFDTGGYINNGYLFVDIVTDKNLNLYYKDILIFSTKSNVQKMIPCVFEPNSYIRVIGESESVSILVSGAKFKTCHEYYLLLLHNKIVKFEGNKYVTYNFTSADDLKNQNYINDMEIGNLIDVQSFVFNDLNYIGYLYNDNGVYFMSNMDNYTQRHIIIDKCDGARIVPDSEYNLLYIFYLYNNKLFYKIMGSDFAITEEKGVNIALDDAIESIPYMQIINFSKPILHIKLNNDKSLFLVINNEKISCQLIKKSKNIKSICDSNTLEVFAIESGILNIYKYNILSVDDEIRIVPIYKSNPIFNVDDVIKSGDSYLLFNEKFCTEVSGAEIFRS